MPTWTLALLIIFSLACGTEEGEPDEAKRAEDCIELINRSLECVEKKTLEEARVDEPNNLFLQHQTQESWARYTLCKTRAREHWGEAQKRELDDCRQFFEALEARDSNKPAE
jgi:hypothetical protein